MGKLEYAGPNAEQIQYWNEQSGPKWVDRQALLDEQLEPLGRRAMDAAGVAPGQHVLDVGCGCGQTTLELARRVAPGGRAVGADVSTVMLDRARARARELGVANVTFEEADAQTHRFGPNAFDVVYSRFGIMFFADSDAGFANLAAALRGGGRVTFVCWRTPAENPWMMVPMMAALQHLPPFTPPDPDAPGPFRFADADKVRAILGRSGFRDVTVDPLDETLTVGGGRSSIEDAARFLLYIGPLASALREATSDTVERVAAAVRDSLEPYHGPDGVRMSSGAWIVTARRA